MESLQASIIAVLAYTLCDHAREAGRQDVCHELQQYFEDSDLRLFIDRLEASPCDAEEALGVWTISWEIEAEFGSDEQAELRHAIEEYLDEALDELEFGYVDGGQAGSGTMEVFCVSLNASLDESWFVHTCEKAGFPRPYSIAFER